MSVTEVIDLIGRSRNGDRMGGRESLGRSTNDGGLVGRGCGCKSSAKVGRMGDLKSSGSESGSAIGGGRVD